MSLEQIRLSEHHGWRKVTREKCGHDVGSLKSFSAQQERLVELCWKAVVVRHVSLRHSATDYFTQSVTQLCYRLRQEEASSFQFVPRLRPSRDIESPSPQRLPSDKVTRALDTYNITATQLRHASLFFSGRLYFAITASFTQLL